MPDIAKIAFVIVPWMVSDETEDIQACPVPLKFA